MFICLFSRSVFCVAASSFLFTSSNSAAAGTNCGIYYRRLYVFTMAPVDRAPDRFWTEVLAQIRSGRAEHACLGDSAAKRRQPRDFALVYLPERGDVQ